MNPLILVETIHGARPLSGAQILIYCRSFPAVGSTRGHRFTFLAIDDALDPEATAAKLLSGIAFERIPSGDLGAYALVVNPGSNFQTVDELVVGNVSSKTGEITVHLKLTQVESADGEPTRLDVFLIMPLIPETLTKRIRFTFSVQNRTYDGNVTNLEGAVSDCVVEL